MSASDPKADITWSDIAYRCDPICYALIGVVPRPSGDGRMHRRDFIRVIADSSRPPRAQQSDGCVALRSAAYPQGQANVRDWPLADIPIALRNIRFGAKATHRLGYFGRSHA